MLPSPDRFLAGLAFPLRRYGWTGPVDTDACALMLAEAERLSAGDERAEPAALFYACASRSRALFGKASMFIVPFLARAHAQAVGVHLDVEDVALIILHTRVLRREIDFEELRTWFDGRLRPL